MGSRFISDDGLRLLWNDLKARLGNKLGLNEKAADSALFDGQPPVNFVKTPSGGNEHDLLERGETESEGRWIRPMFYEDEAEAIRAVMAGKPLKPQNVYPADEAAEIYQVPTFVGTRYESTASTHMDKFHLQVSLSADFSTPIFDQEFVQTTVELEPEDFWAIIETSTEYHWRIRYQDDRGRWSDWSEPTKFTTQAVFEPTVIVQPRILYPLDGALVPPVNPFVASSRLQVKGGAGMDVHESTHWQACANSLFVGDLALDEPDDTDNLTTKELDLALTGNMNVRCRYKEGNSGIYSPFSLPRLIRPRPLYTDLLIGIGFRRTDTFLVPHRIDIDGNDVLLPLDYFHNHPIYNFELRQIAGQDMAGVIPFYVRAHTNENAEIGEDLHQYWIAPYEFTDSYFHPAFALSGGNKVWLSRVWSTSNNLNSDINSTGNVRQDTYDPTITHLNTDVDADHRGWSQMTFYEFVMQMLLMMIEYNSIDVSRMPPNTWSGQSVKNPNVAAWHGVHLPFFGQGISSNVRVYHLRGVENRRPTVASGILPHRRIALSSSVDDLNVSETMEMSVHTGDWVERLKSGYSEFLGCHRELFFMPDVMSAGNTKGFGADISETDTGLTPFRLGNGNIWGNIPGEFHCAIRNGGANGAYRLVKRF